MKISSLLTLCFCLFLARPGFAALNDEPDQIGVYFDEEALEVCLDVPASTEFDAYMIITNPSSVVESGLFAVCTEVPPGLEGFLLLIGRTWPGGCPPPIDTGLIEPCRLGYAVGCGHPIPPGPGGVVVMTHQYMLLAEMPVDFYLGPGIGLETPIYGGPSGEEIPLGISSGSPDLPVASINGGCTVVPVETSTFGSMKSLYR